MKNLRQMLESNKSTDSIVESLVGQSVKTHLTESQAAQTVRALMDKLPSTRKPRSYRDLTVATLKQGNLTQEEVMVLRKMYADLKNKNLILNFEERTFEDNIVPEEAQPIGMAESPFFYPNAVIVYNTEGYDFPRYAFCVHKKILG